MPPVSPVTPVRLAYESFTERLKKAMWRAGELAGERQSNYIGTEDLAQAILEDSDDLAPQWDPLKRWWSNRLNHLVEALHPTPLRHG